MTLLPLAKQTRSEDVFSALWEFMHAAGLDATKMVSLITDGAPAMTGKERGLITRMKAVQPKLVAYHCIIHQSSLCSKLCDNSRKWCLLLWNWWIFKDVIPLCSIVYFVLFLKRCLQNLEICYFTMTSDGYWNGSGICTKMLLTSCSPWRRRKLQNF